MHHYTESGLKNIFLVNGFNVQTIDDEEYVSIDNVESLHKTIGQIITEKKASLAGDEIRFLRVNMNLSQKQVGHYLGVDSQTVARWEKGQCDIPRTADVVLRGMFIESIESERGFGHFLGMLADAEQEELRDYNLVYLDGWREEQVAM